MGIESKYTCDRCGREGLEQHEYNTVTLFEQSYKYAGHSYPDVCLCENCTDEFILLYGLIPTVSYGDILQDGQDEIDEPTQSAESDIYESEE